MSLVPRHSHGQPADKELAEVHGVFPGAQQGSVEVRPVMNYDTVGIDREVQAEEAAR